VQQRVSEDYSRAVFQFAGAFWRVGGEKIIEEIGGFMSATDKAKDKVQTAKGQVKEATGKAVGNSSLEAEGKGDQVKGNLKQAGEKIKDAVKK
jgi:uncharacterized protein YjbJ (UPF0337 family)